MAFDGIMTNAVCREFDSLLRQAKVEKINQPEKDLLIIQLRAYNEESRESRSYSLLLSANAVSARAHFSKLSLENPIKAPNFCMLLRKHLGAARLVDVTQPSFERVLIFRFEGRTEMFESTERLLILEIMGRCSNMILTDGNKRIIDALHTSDLSFAKRQLVPGFTYELPPAQEKTAPRRSYNFDYACEKRADKYLLETFLGFSPLCSREIVNSACGRTDISMSEMTDIQRDRFSKAVDSFVSDIEKGAFMPTVLYDGEPTDYYCFDIGQYGGVSVKKHFSLCSEAIDEYFSRRQQTEHMKRSSSDISKLLHTIITRVSRKIETQRGELAECEKAMNNKRLGDIVSSNIYLLKGGEKTARLTDFYAEEPTEIEISLDPRLTPSQNAQRFYKLYKKAQSTKKYLSVQIPLSLEELKYLESVQASVSTAESAAELGQIRRELTEQGYIGQTHSRQKQQKPPAMRFTELRSSDGFTIYIGKNNLQNDELTLKIADKRDIWFHVKNYAGSHTIVISNGQAVPDRTLTEAAVAAATFSSVSDSKNVEVDYTEVRNVKKPSGARPGRVIYETYKTAVVEPNRELIDELIVKK